MTDRMRKTASTTVPVHPLLAERWSPRGFDRAHEIGDEALAALLEAVDDPFPVLDGVDADAAVRSVRTPVLAVSVDDDQYTPHETLDHLCRKLAAAPVTRERYTAAEAGAPLNHFSWVRASTPLAARVAAFAATLPKR